MITNPRYLSRPSANIRKQTNRYASCRRTGWEPSLLAAVIDHLAREQQRQRRGLPRGLLAAAVARPALDARAVPLQARRSREPAVRRGLGHLHGGYAQPSLRPVSAATAVRQAPHIGSCAVIAVLGSDGHGPRLDELARDAHELAAAARDGQALPGCSRPAFSRSVLLFDELESGCRRADARGTPSRSSCWAAPCCGGGDPKAGRRNMRWLVTRDRAGQRSASKRLRVTAHRQASHWLALAGPSPGRSPIPARTARTRRNARAPPVTVLLPGAR